MLPSAAPAGPPGPDAFAQRLAPGAARIRSVRELHGWLLALAPEAPLDVRQPGAFFFPPATERE